MAAGASDTLELWRDAAGLCARMHARAGAAEYVHTFYIDID